MAAPELPFWWHDEEAPAAAPSSPAPSSPEPAEAPPAAPLPTSCTACERARPTRYFPDRTGACEACYGLLRAVSAGCPACPSCGHPYWVQPDDIHGHLYRCDCGLKFTREAAAADRAARTPKPAPARVLFAPRF